MPSDMRHLDLTLPSPAENLACDEALLELQEAGGGPGLIRFWESSTYFIVVGYANRVREEIHEDACRERAVPVLRRCSGGGTVLQGPGCLNYSVVLPLSCVGPDPTITATNRFVMERNRSALEKLLGEPVSIAGHTDLVLGDRKFSGNAQRRKRESFLFHGTFLLNFDRALIEKTLRPPPRQPDYRRHRSHADFVIPLPVTSTEIKEALKMAWNAMEPDEVAFRDGSPIAAQIRSLVTNRYGTSDWNFKF